MTLHLARLTPEGVSQAVTCAVARPAQSEALLARCRTWIDSHNDQAIIAGSLIIGFWFIADSLYLIVS